MIVEHDVTVRHEHDNLDDIEVLCAGEFVKFVRERTCENGSMSDLEFECSRCGEAFRKPQVVAFHYCPNCGAKVVEE